jgi:hypothetical protein
MVLRAGDGGLGMQHQDLRLLLRLLYTRARSRSGDSLPQVPVERALQPCIHDDPASMSVRLCIVLFSIQMDREMFFVSTHHRLELRFIDGSDGATLLRFHLFLDCLKSWHARTRWSGRSFSPAREAVGLASTLWRAQQFYVDDPLFPMQCAHLSLSIALSSGYPKMIRLWLGGGGVRACGGGGVDDGGGGG